MAWGPSGEVEMDYNLTAGLSYKVYAKAGYKGLWRFSDPNNNDAYSAGPGVPMTKNGAAFTIVWRGSDGGTTTPTALSNAYCETTDTDCVAAGDCTVSPDDGHGHSVFTFQCGSGYDLIGLVFRIGSSVPVEIFTVNPYGNSRLGAQGGRRADERRDRRRAACSRNSTLRALDSITTAIARSPSRDEVPHH